MSESAVKLFGWTMPSLFLPLSSTKDTSSSSSFSSSSSPPLMVNDGFVSDNKSELDNKSIEISSSDFEAKEVSENNSSDQQSEITTTTSTTSEDKTLNLKKPDKILPCPRCKSSDTKFCYYNNYNVNQPRYFCRNCQRYWTAGGSMRSVPIGSGRRKNKGWASSDHNYLQINSENTQNSTKILTFGSSNSSISEDTKIASESTSPQGFLPQQVTFPVSSPWPNQQWSTTSTHAGFYPMPVYWACTVPFWPTQETVTTSTSLGKRSRDHQTSDESDQSIDDELRLGSKNHVWSPVAMRHENKERLSFFNGFESKSSDRRVMVPQNAHNLQANPAAMARSMSFRERM